MKTTIRGNRDGGDGPAIDRFLPTAGRCGVGAALAGILLAATGCSGINASKSVSPMDFLLPGLMYSPPAPVVPGAAGAPTGLAQASGTSLATDAPPTCAL